MAAMFDLPVTSTSSECNHICLTVLLDPENVKVAVGSRCYCYLIQADIYEIV